MAITSHKPSIARISLASSQSSWRGKQIQSIFIGKERKLIFFGMRLSLSRCTAVWQQHALIFNQKASVIVISSLPIFSSFRITNLSLSTSERAKTIFMIQMMRIDRLSQWPLFEALHNIFRLSYGKLTLSMVAPDSPNIIFINLMFSVPGLF